MKKVSILVCALLSFSVFACVAAELADLAYQDVAWVKKELHRRGFDVAVVPSNKAQYWWSNTEQQCIRIEIDGSKVTAVSQENQDECGAVAQHHNSHAATAGPDHEQSVSISKMPEYCSNYAARDFGVKQSNIIVLPAEKARNKYMVPGQNDDVFFSCYFNRKGQFMQLVINK